jgi:hypothetical protein
VLLEGIATCRACHGKTEHAAALRRRQLRRMPQHTLSQGAHRQDRPRRWACRREARGL